jgi:hypothetical protein
MTPLESKKKNLPTKSETIRHFLGTFARDSFFNPAERLVANGYWNNRVDSN